MPPVQSFSVFIPTLYMHVYNGCMCIYVVLSEASLLVFLFYSKISPAK